MSDSEISTTEVTDAAKNPKRVTGDEGTVEERTVQELIDADRFACAKTATGVPYGMRVARIRFPGTQA